MVLVKILTFSRRLFVFRIGLKIMFDFVREKKEGFLDYKNDIRKRSKNWGFLRGQPTVLIKILTFSMRLFFFKLGLNILFYFVLERKEGFLDYKNDIRKQSKNWDFFKGVNLWFWSKFFKFSLSLFFVNLGQIYCLISLQRKNKASQTIKMTLEKRRKIGIFPKGLTHGFGQNFQIFFQFVFL